MASRMMDSFSLGRRAVLAGMAIGAVSLKNAAAADLAPRLIPNDYSLERETFRTRLVSKGPAPDGFEPLREPANADQIAYSSGAAGKLKLTAWVSRYKVGAVARPAVLFLHGGNAMGSGHWELMTAYTDAGYVVMMPSMRGENGQQGNFSGFYNEVEDVLAAADTLRRLPGIDINRLFIAGHSIGGTLTMLAAMSAHGFRAAAPISGNADSFRFFDRYPQDIRFDKTDPHEFEVRSALCYAGSFKCPVHVYHGTEEKHFDGRNALLVKRARAGGVLIDQTIVGGTHTTALPIAIRHSIGFFERVAG